MSFPEMLMLLTGCRDCYRRSTKTPQVEFFELNDPKTVRERLAYLLYGEGDTIQRIANMIFNNDYRLHDFGQASVQELVGWCNQEDLPVINSRTTKILRFLGFEVRQIR